MLGKILLFSSRPSKEKMAVRWSLLVMNFGGFFWELSWLEGPHKIQTKIIWSFEPLFDPSFVFLKAGASNLRSTGRMRSRNIFVRPKLDSELKEKSVF
jgi:hypothetical protein